jgi:hypothetical protein
LRLPLDVVSPDCHPASTGSSRTRNQSIMSMRGCLRAIANACVRYRAWIAKETPNAVSGGFVW